MGSQKRSVCVHPSVLSAPPCLMLYNIQPHSGPKHLQLVASSMLQVFSTFAPGQVIGTSLHNVLPFTPYCIEMVLPFLKSLFQLTLPRVSYIRVTCTVRVAILTVITYCAVLESQYQALLPAQLRRGDTRVGPASLRHPVGCCWGHQTRY